MIEDILINITPQETRVAIVLNGVVQDLVKEGYRQSFEARK